MAFDNVLGSYNIIRIQRVWSEIQIKTELQKDIDHLSKRSSESTKTKPQINIDSSKSGTIEEKPLKQ